jgi:hypothetical protein
MENYKRLIIQQPQKKDSWFLIIIILLFAGATVAMIYLYFKEKKTCVEPGSIPKIKGNYAAQQGLAGKQLVTCGSDSNKPCIFSSSNSVEAFSLCNTVPSICQAFSYEPSQGIVTFIDQDSKFDTNANVITFVRQVPVETSSTLIEQQILTEKFS